jgi:PmbA protein
VRGAPSREAVEEASAFLIRRALEKGAAGADVVYRFSRGGALSLRDGEVEKNSYGTSAGIGLRTLDRWGRQGAAQVNSLERPFLEDLAQWSLNNCAYSEPDPYVHLGPGCPFPLPDLELYDPEVEAVAPEFRMEVCKEMGEIARDAHPGVVSVRSASWGEGAGEYYYGSSEGQSLWYSATSAGCGVSVVLTAGDDIMEMGGSGDDSRFISGLDPRKAAAEAVSRTAMVMGGKPLPTGRYDIVLDGEAAASLVEVIGELFLAPAIHKNRSFLKGKLGEHVASRALTLTDDGLLKRGLGASPFDGEGVPRAKTPLLTGGTAAGWLYNLKYALIDGVKSTGNGSRSLSGTPDADTTNLVLEPGAATLEELFRQAGNGIYVTELLGFHTLNPVSGEFSIGIKGASLSGGAPGGAVSGMIIAGNLKDVMMNIDLVGRDFRFYGSVGACPLVIRDVAASGC